MKAVGIAELKDNLSKYLDRVRSGEEIVVRDRNVPVAKIVPLSAADDWGAEEVALVAVGRLRLPERPLPASFWSLPAPRVSRKRAAAAVSADRDES